MAKYNLFNGREITMSLSEFAQYLNTGQMVRDVTEGAEKILKSSPEIKRTIKQKIEYDVRKRAIYYAAYGGLPEKYEPDAERWSDSFKVIDQKDGKYSVVNDHPMNKLFQEGDSDKGIPPSFIDKTFDFYTAELVKEHTEAGEAGWDEVETTGSPWEHAQIRHAESIRLKAMRFGIKLDHSKKATWKEVTIEVDDDKKS